MSATGATQQSDEQSVAADDAELPPSTKTLLQKADEMREPLENMYKRMQAHYAHFAKMNILPVIEEGKQLSKRHTNYAAVGTAGAGKSALLNMLATGNISSRFPLPSKKQEKSLTKFITRLRCVRVDSPDSQPTEMEETDDDGTEVAPPSPFKIGNSGAGVTSPLTAAPAGRFKVTLVMMKNFDQYLVMPARRIDTDKADEVYQREEANMLQMARSKSNRDKLKSQASKELRQFPAQALERAKKLHRVEGEKQLKKEEELRRKGQPKTRDAFEEYAQEEPEAYYTDLASLRLEAVQYVLQACTEMIMKSPLLQRMLRYIEVTGDFPGLPKDVSLIDSMVRLSCTLMENRARIREQNGRFSAATKLCYWCSRPAFPTSNSECLSLIFAFALQSLPPGLGLRCGRMAS
jgi:hypothetical protein